MTAYTRGVRDGFHLETRKVSTLTDHVADIKDGWDRGDNLDVPGVRTVSEIYSDLSTVVANYGMRAGKDTHEFDRFGTSIQIQDKEDAQ